MLVVTNLGDIQLLLDRVRNASEKYSLELTIRKTKFMVISRTNAGPGALLVENEEVEGVDRFM